MDFEQYLERDILTFLDSKMQKKEGTAIDREEEYGLYLTKDYLKELTYALDNDELTKAKKLFDELKANYSKLPRNSVERKKIYSLLEKMYEKIQNYVRIKEGRIEVIKQGDSEILKDKADKFTEIADISGKKKEEDTITAPVEIKINKAAIPFNMAGTEEGLPEPAKGVDIAQETESPSTILEDISQDLKDSLPPPEAPFGMMELPKEETAQEPPAAKAEDTAAVETKPAEEIQKKKEKHKKRQDIQEEEKKKEEIPQKVMTGKPELGSRKHRELDDIKDEIIDRTAGHLEKLKTHVTNKLLHELRKKLDEKGDEHSNKIDLLRKELLLEMMKELDRRFKIERRELDHKMKMMKEDIITQVYSQAGHIVFSSDNLTNIVQTGQDTQEIHDDKDDIITNPATMENRDQEGSGQDKKLKVVYEQAVYFMFDNKYAEAAKLFRQIIESQPNNRAARIRLQECLERQPEIREDLSDVPASEDIIRPETAESPDVIIQRKGTGTKPQESLEQSSMMWGIEQETANKMYDSLDIEEDVKEFSDGMDADVKNITLEEEESQKTGKDSDKTQAPAVNARNDARIRKMYEEAIYSMFQKDYGTAAKIFKEILRINPENRAARIRLHECLERQPEISEENLNPEDTPPRATEDAGDIEQEPSEETIAPPQTPKVIEKIPREEMKEDNQNDTLTISYNTEEPQESEPPRLPRLKNRKNEDRLRKMYEEAIYTMFQSNYEDAAKIFTEILRISPDNKAAKIRLQECKEAINNA